MFLNILPHGYTTRIVAGHRGMAFIEGDVLNFLCNEADEVINNFLLTLGRGDYDQKEKLESVFQEFDTKLNQCLIKIKSLPPSPAAVVLELSILYNLLFASTAKAWLCQQNPFKITSSLAGTTKSSLRRAQQMLGGSCHAQGNDNTHGDQAQAEQVSAVLSSLLNVLSTVENRDVRQSVGLLSCMWSLIILLENGLPSSLPSLSPVLSWSSQETEVVLKHGLLVPKLPSTLSLKDRENKRDGDVGVVQNFAHLLLAVSCFHKQNWTECRDHASKVDHPKWKFLATVLTARAMLASGSCLEAVAVLHSALNTDTDSVSPDTVSHIYRLLASCYAAQNLPHLAVEMLHHCLQIEPGSTASLFMLAKQFQTLKQSDAEIKCLEALVKVSEKTVGQETSSLLRPPLLDDLLQEVIAPHDAFTVSQALYCLATRLAELQKYEESSQAYMRLIQVFEKEDSKKLQGHQQPSEMCLPDLLTVSREAAQVYLKIPQYRQCLHLCDRVLSAISSVSRPSKPAADSDFPVFPSPQQMSTKADESWIASQADNSAEEKDLVFKFKSGRKRWLSSERDDWDGKIVWKDEENRALLMMCKAECLVASHDQEAAVKVLSRTFQGLMECWRKVEGQRSGEGEPGSTWQRPLTSNPKRPRYSLTSDKATEEAAPVDEDGDQNEAWRLLSTQVCLYLADAHCRCDQHQQALHSARLAAQMEPENEQGQYFLSSVLMKLGRGQEGCQNWLASRGLPYNTASVRLQSAIQQRQDMIRTASTDTGTSEQRRLGTVTDRQKLDLDLACLQLLLDSKTKR